jgi:hypothetical protein
VDNAWTGPPPVPAACERSPWSGDYRAFCALNPPEAGVAGSNPAEGTPIEHMKQAPTSGNASRSRRHCTDHCHTSLSRGGDCGSVGVGNRLRPSAVRPRLPARASPGPGGFRLHLRRRAVGRTTVQVRADQDRPRGRLHAHRAIRTRRQDDRGCRRLVLRQLRVLSVVLRTEVEGQHAEEGEREQPQRAEHQVPQ